MPSSRHNPHLLSKTRARSVSREGRWPYTADSGGQGAVRETAYLSGPRIDCAAAASGVYGSGSGVGDGNPESAVGAERLEPLRTVSGE